MTHPLQWKKFHPLSDQNAFICLVDHMGNDSSIVQAARVSYGRDKPGKELNDCCFNNWQEVLDELKTNPSNVQEHLQDDIKLIRYLMNHSHTTPFEMVEIKFMVQVPMDCWRQWIRHRTASVNEYSTRYTEALDMQQTTLSGEWRLQATDNKQGSSGFLTNKDLGELITPEEAMNLLFNMDEYQMGSRTDACHVLSHEESLFHKMARKVYELRLKFGIAKEQVRKDLPLSTYTRAYWKCDLHNIFNFLRLRMDSHAQLEIRSFANCMFEIVKEICPVACEAFEDYVLHAKRFSRMEMEITKEMYREVMHYKKMHSHQPAQKPDSLTEREWKEFLGKLS